MQPRVPARTVERLLTPGEVAQIFRVDPKTVTRWANAGKLRYIRTPGGHHRYLESAVQALLHLENPPHPGSVVVAVGPVGEPGRQAEGAATTTAPGGEP